MKFHKLFRCFINLLVWLLLIIFVLPTLAILFLWKCSVILAAKLFYSNLHPTRPNDTYFAIDDAQGISIVNAAQIWKIKGKICVHQFRKHFYNCFLADQDSRKRYHNFYCYLARFGGYVFKKSVKEIDLEQQIVERTLDPGTSLESWISKWFLEEKFRDNAPLWSIVILHLPPSNKQDDEICESIFLYKNHHVLMDGYGFIHMIDKLTGSQSPYLVKDEEDSFFEKLKDAFLFPTTLAEYYFGVSRARDIFYPIKNPSDMQWYLGLTSLDLKTLKEIRRKTKTHFITLMMSIMIGALRRLIIEKRTKEEDIPQNIYTANSLPWPNHPRNRYVNHWSGGVFNVPFKTTDPLLRLQRADSFFKHFHDIHMHKMVKRLIIPVTWCIPCFILRLGHSMDLYYFRYSNTFASLMLSEETHYLLGKKIENIYLPLGLTKSVPTCVMFGVSTSHSAKVDLSIVANSEIVSSQADIDRLTKVYFAMEIEKLQTRLQESSNNNDFLVEFQQ